MQETIIAELHPTAEDIKTLRKLSGRHIPFKKDNEDYSSAIVKNPGVTNTLSSKTNIQRFGSFL